MQNKYNQSLQQNLFTINYCPLNRTFKLTFNPKHTFYNSQIITQNYQTLTSEINSILKFYNNPNPNNPLYQFIDTNSLSKHLYN